jgi:uncharacterized tellurite resistance protein B-like protein
MSEMSEKGLQDRRRSLEESFFQGEREDLRARIAAEQEEAVESIAAATGLSDAALLERLAGLGIRAETLAALTLVPLVEVAWADGEMDEREQDAILRGAESTGLRPDSPSYGLLELWTRDRPAPELMESWCAYIAALCAELAPGQRKRLEQRIMGRARAVAEAAGGILGIGRISRVEEGVLAKMERAFDA